jgi:serine/threonine protein kinase
MPESPADQLGLELDAVGIVTRAQWREALTRVGGHPRAALDLLSRVRAHWAPAGDPAPPPALTRYQLDQIAAWLNDPGDPDRLRRALVWNDYLLLEPAGEGGMGVVYKGWDRARSRYVAIKRTLSDSAEIRKRMLREAELLARLDHPNIARFYSRERYGEQDLLVMEYLSGSTLSEVIRQRGPRKPAPWRFVAEMAAALLDALHHIHGNNPVGVTVIHRDVKPSNVMLQRVDNAYRPKLLDMGLGKAVDPDPADGGYEVLTRQFQLLGTPEYMAPEQWEGGDRAVPGSDVYGLGGTLYFALTGQPPFGSSPTDRPRMAAMAAMAERHTRDPRPRVAKLRHDVPGVLDELIRRMMAVDPRDRGTPAELRDRFRELLAEPPAARVVPTDTLVGKPPPNPAPPIATEPATRPPTQAIPPAPAPPPSTGVGTGDKGLPVAEEVEVPPISAVAAATGMAGDRGWEFRRAFGAWLRSFARPATVPGRYLILLLLAAVVGYWVGWGWAAGLLAAVGAAVLLAFADRG